MTTIHLKPGREKPLLRNHPWIFSGGISHIEGKPVDGETVDIFSSKGQFLARGAYSSQSQIRARVWTFEPDQAIDADFFRNRIRTAIQARSGLASVTDSYRLIHAESDGIPGLIVDRYKNMLVLQSLTAGAEAWKNVLAELLLEETGADGIYERSDADVRELEGLPSQIGLLCGKAQTEFEISEHQLKFAIDLAAGHKTGFYLDQRDNRLMVRQYSAAKDVLDCFCYSGGFTVNVLAGGANSVTAVDSSSSALAAGQENITRNQLPTEKVTWLEGDVFKMLRKFRDENRSFDLIILDPPKFAPTAAQAEKAARGYKDINLLAFKLLRPGGYLFTFSCSGGIDASLFQKIVAGAALDANVHAQIIGYMAQGSDHPVLLSFPEGAYLKGLICRKI